jgi:hypothetical protein
VPSGRPVEQWITIAGVDPWILAAAHAGDIRAMRCAAHKVSYRPSDEYIRRMCCNWPDDETLASLPSESVLEAGAADATRRERARWYAVAAGHGDDKAAAELADIARPAQERWDHAIRRLAAHGHRSADLNCDALGAEHLELCRAGADAGSVSCMERWARHLRTLGPEHQAEAQRWQEKAEDLRKAEREPWPEDSGIRCRTLGEPGTIAIIAAVTSVVVTFVQAMITKAGEDSYEGLRKYLRSLFRHSVPSPDRPARVDQLLIIAPPDGQPPAAVLQVWTDLPDEAISALTQMLYDMRAAQQPDPAAERRWYWNGAARRWQILQLPPAGDGPPGTGDQPHGS